MLVRRIGSAFAVIAVLAITFLGAPSAQAGGGPDNPPVPPASSWGRFGVVELENVLDPGSPRYDPGQRYGPAGTRFGPPGARVDSPPTPANGGAAPLVALDQDFYGTILYDGKGVVRVQATQKVDTSITLDETNDNVFVTLMPPDHARLESAASYYYNGSSMERYWKAFDHYTNSFVVAVAMDSSFISTYSSGGYVTTTITKTGAVPLWSIYLYNWVYSRWDCFAGAYGNSEPGDAAYGWDVWEAWNIWNTWPSLPQLRSSYLYRFQAVDGTGYLVQQPYGGGPFYQEHSGFPYNPGFNGQWYDWYVGPGG